MRALALPPILSSALVLLAVFAAFPARAADRTWTGLGASDAWSDAGNWTGGVPAASDHAIIPAGTPRSPRLTAPASAARLSLAAGAALDARGFRLTLGAGPHDISGTLRIGASALTTRALEIGGAFVVRGRMEWEAGVVYADTYYLPPGDRVLTVAPEGTLVWAADAAAGRQVQVAMDVQGTLRWEGGNTQLDQGYAWQSSGLFDVALAAAAVLQGVGINNIGPWIWTNRGTIRTAGSVTLQQVQLRTLGGTVDVQAGVLRLNASTRWEQATVAVSSGARLVLGHQGSGVWHEVAGTLAGTPAGDVVLDTENWASGIVAAAGGGTVNLGGTGLKVARGYVGGRSGGGNAIDPPPVNAGLMRFVGAEHRFVYGTLVSTGTLRWEAGDVWLGRSFDPDNPPGLRVEGLLDVATAAPARFITDGFTPGPLEVAGTMRHTGAGPTTLEAEFRLSGGTLGVEAGMLVLGSVATGRWADATVHVAAGASLRLVSNRGFYPQIVSGTLAGQIDGSFEAGTAASFHVSLLADPVRGGTLALDGAGLRLVNAYFGGGFGEFEPYPAPANAGRLVIDGAQPQFVERPFTNTGEVVWTGGRLLQRPGVVVTNAGTWTLAAPSGSWERLGAGTLLRNTGTLHSTAAAALGIDLRNEGLLRLGSVLTMASGGTFENAFGGTLAGDGTLDVTALQPAQVVNTGTVAPGAPGGGPGTLTWRGRFPMDPQARLVLEVGPGAAGDRLDVAGTAALASQLVVRTVGGYAPALGDAFDGVTATTRTGAFAAVSTVTAGGVVFDADYADPARVRLVAVAGDPAPPFVVSPSPLVAGGVRTAVLLGDDLDPEAELSLVCRDCADPAGSGVLRGAVRGTVPGGLAVAFDLTAIGDYGDYDVVLGTGAGARRARVEVEPFLALPVLLPTGAQGVFVRPAPLGLTSTQSLYNATNSAEPSVLFVRADVDAPVRYDALGVALAGGEAATRTFFAPAGASLRQPVPVTFRSGIAPGDVRFPGQPPLPGDPRVPLFSSVPARFEVYGGLSRFQFTDALSRVAYEAALETGQPVTPDAAWDAAEAAVAALFGETGDALVAQRGGGMSVQQVAEIMSAIATNPLTMRDVIVTGLNLQSRRDQGNGCRPPTGFLQGTGGGRGSCTGRPVPAPPPPVPLCPASPQDVQRRRRAIQHLIDRALADPNVRNTELVIRLQEELDGLPAPFAGGNAACSESRPVFLQPIVAAFDPNDKLAPAPFGVEVVGSGTEATAGRTLIPLARAADAVAYTIRFENVAEATAAAETVTITDVLDERFDPATLEFLGSTADSLLTVAVSGQTVTFTFAGIELPPNRTPPEGEGAVSFRVRPRQAYPDGTEFRNAADIVFDFNPPIVTPEVVHVIRATADLGLSLAAAADGAVGQPLVYVATVANAAGADPAEGVVLTLPVPAQATLVDAAPSTGACAGAPVVVCSLGTLGPGAAATVALTVMPQASGEIVQTATAQTATFDGSWYDNAAAVRTLIAAVSGESVPGLPAALLLEAPAPNPARTGASVRVGLPAAAALRLAVYDMLGREVLRVADGPAEAGWQVHRLDLGRLAAGVYVLRAHAGDSVVAQRLTVAR